jgi:hypothetical protein
MLVLENSESFSRAGLILKLLLWMSNEIAIHLMVKFS